MKLNYFSSKSFSKILVLTIAVLVSTLFFNSSANSTTQIITVSSYQFTPSNVSVSVGDTIKWQWLDGTHTTTCTGTTMGTMLPSGASTWGAQITSATPTYTYVVTVAGTYNYVCEYHFSFMAGTFVANASGSSIYLTENFSYPTGDSLGLHGWNWVSGNTNILMSTAPGLTYAGYPLSNIGNATTLASSGEDMYKDLSAVDSVGSIYTSCMIKVDAAQRQGDYFLAFLQTGSTTFYEGRLSARIVDGNVNFGITKGNSGSDTAVAGIWTTGNYALGTTYLVVLKYTFVPEGTNNDMVSLYVFSSAIPSVEPTPTVGPLTYGSLDATSIGRIALRQGTATRAPNCQVDGIRVTSAWSDISTLIQSVSSSVPEKFNLSQNYPNPFNPTTTIKFSIPERGFVNLVVYNSLGREVSRLVNENLNPGSYSSNFSGADLNSGVYFYKLFYADNKGNNFVETKKLVLLK